MVLATYIICKEKFELMYVCTSERRFKSFKVGKKIAVL